MSLVGYEGFDFAPTTVIEEEDWWANVALPFVASIAAAANVFAAQPPNFNDDIVPFVAPPTVVEEEYYLQLPQSRDASFVEAPWKYANDEIVSVPNEDYWLQLPTQQSQGNYVVTLWKYEQNDFVSRVDEAYWLRPFTQQVDNLVPAPWLYEQNDVVPQPVAPLVDEDYWYSPVVLWPDNVVTAAWKYEQNDVVAVAPTIALDDSYYIPPRMQVEVPPLLKYVEDEITVFIPPTPIVDEEYWINPVVPSFPDNRPIDLWLREQYEAIPVGAHVPLTSSDLIAYSSAGRPLDDVSLSGGAIDSKVRPVFTQLSSEDDIEALSSSAADDGQLQIIGRGTDGQIISATIQLNGTSLVANATVFRIVFSIECSKDAVGVITVRRSPGGAAICIIPSGERGVSAMFKGASSETGQVKRYEKFFWKNVHGSTTLVDGLVRLAVDPEARIKQGVSTMVNDAVFVANRKVQPPGVVFVDDNVDQSVPGGGILLPGYGIGVWGELDLPAHDAQHNSSFFMRISGTS